MGRQYSDNEEEEEELVVPMSELMASRLTTPQARASVPSAKTPKV